MPSHSPSAEQWSGVAFVSGPRTVNIVLPFCLVTTISQWLAATEINEPARSLWARQILSTKGESDGLSSKVKIMHLPPVPGAAMVSSCGFKGKSGEAVPPQTPPLADRDNAIECYLCG